MKPMKKLKRFQGVFLVLLLLLGLQACRQTPSGGPQFGIEKGLVTEQAMVVSAHPEASRVGTQILSEGGNAVDAAVAVQYALAVVYPIAGNIGGGGFMVVRLADGTTASLDFREKAPLAATRDIYLDETGEPIPNLSTDGPMAAGVPGSVAGMEAAWEIYGQMESMEPLIQPAIDLARNGFALTASQAANLNNYRERFLQFNDSTCAFLKKEGEWQAGDLLIQEDLAQTLERIRDNGRDGFYKGQTMELITATMQPAPDTSAISGMITQSDLEKYEAVWREPIEGKYENLKIITMGPPSSGGICLMQMLGMVGQFPLEKYGWQSPEAVHCMVEAERRAYADRAEHLGDPDFWPVPVEGLLSGEYLKKRMADFDHNAASSSEAVSAGAPAPKESDQTTHFSIVDKEGNAVSITTTLNGGYGSKVVVKGAGFLLNNEMDDFSIKPGYPNLYGLVGAEANAIEPQKRMLSSMTPTIVERKGKLWMVVGTPGGSTIITSVFQTILNAQEYGMTMQEAVAAKKFHHQWLPDMIQYEPGGLDSTDVLQLESMGHQTKERDPIGRVDAIMVLPNGRLEGGADPRGDDSADGF